MGLIYKIYNLSYFRQKNRIDIFDFLRGIAMLFVLLQHAGFPGYKLLLCFHMPLFFFLSGIVSGSREMPDFGHFFSSRFKRLMIPYFCFGLIDILYFKVSDLIKGIPYDFKWALYGLLTGQYGYTPAHQGGIYWFFLTLFVAELLIYPIKKYLRKNKLLILGGAIFFAFLSYISTHGLPMPLFTFEKSFMAASFLLIGVFCHTYDYKLLDNEFHLWEVILIIFGFMGLVVSLKMNNEPVLMYLNRYGNYFWFFIGAISGILSAIVGGKHLYLMLRSDIKFVYYRLLMWMGYNSLVLFIVHIFVNVWTEKCCTLIGISYFPLNLIAMFALGIPLCNMITYNFPWVLGQFERTKNN